MIKIEFIESTQNCFEAKIFENGKQLEMIRNVTVILRAGKDAIYLKNMPDPWLKSIIDKGIPFNPSRRKKLGN